MQRAIARERPAKIINARGELLDAEELRQPAGILSQWDGLTAAGLSADSARAGRRPKLLRGGETYGWSGGSPTASSSSTCVGGENFPADAVPSADPRSLGDLRLLGQVVAVWVAFGVVGWLVGWLLLLR